MYAPGLLYVCDLGVHVQPLPSQLCVSVSVLEPAHPAPPQEGEGFVQVLLRVLLCVPLPHETEHEPHPLQEPHELQPPFTGQHCVLQLCV